jgi:hypothetical protein
MDQFLDGGAVHADDFVPAVDQRIGRHGAWQRAFVRHDLQPRGFLVGEAEQLLRLVGLFAVEGHLAEQRGGGPFFTLSEFLGQIAPAQAFGDFGRDDFLRDLIAVHEVSPLVGTVDEEVQQMIA